MASTRPGCQKLVDWLGTVTAVVVSIAFLIRALAVAVFETVVLLALVGALVQLGRRLTNP